MSDEKSVELGIASAGERDGANLEADTKKDADVALENGNERKNIFQVRST